MIQVNWKDLGTLGRIEAIRSTWIPGASASEIASCFNGATRNAIIGAYHRHGAYLLDKPLRTPSRSERVVRDKQDKKSKPRRATASFRPEPSQSKPLPAPRVTDSEHRLCGKPLVMLKAKECKWSVNEAEQGGLHLFCGLPSEGSYCEHHESRSYRPAKAS